MVKAKNYSNERTISDKLSVCCNREQRRKNFVIKMIRENRSAFEGLEFKEEDFPKQPTLYKLKDEKEIPDLIRIIKYQKHLDSLKQSSDDSDAPESMT
jgi:hypothetical protein